jgi:hypothetical protein
MNLSDWIAIAVAAIVTPDKPPWWDVAWSTWGLLAVGVAASLIAYFTLKDIKAQTVNATKAAEAAEKSANALISAERAWVMVGIAPHTISRTEGSEETGISFEFHYKNEGRTPAG